MNKKNSQLYKKGKLRINRISAIRSSLKEYDRHGKIGCKGEASMVILECNGAKMHIEEHGAEMRAYSKNGKNFLWSGDAAVWKSVAPVLFPTIGALKDGGVILEGKWYAVPKHGFARDREFEITEQGENYVTLSLCESAETLKVFPFCFKLSITHRFLENGFETRYTVENHSSRTMPFLLGGHPGFVCPLNDGERFEDYILHFDKPEKPETLTCSLQTHNINGTEPVDLGEDGCTLKLRHETFDRLDTYMFLGLNSRKVDLIHSQTRKGIRFSFDMEVLAVWTMPHKKASYVCIEPWQGCPAFADESGHFEDKPFHVELCAGQSYTCGYQMEII